MTEECRIPKGSDLTYLNKLHNEFSNHSNYIKGEDRRKWNYQFGVKHYAGPVIYTVNGFLDKNKDVQQDQLFDIMSESSNSFVRELTKFQDLYSCFTTNKTTMSSSSSTYNNLCNLANGTNVNNLKNGSTNTLNNSTNLTNGHTNGHTNGLMMNGTTNFILNNNNQLNSSSSSNSSQCSSANSTWGRSAGQTIYGAMNNSSNTSKGKPTVADTFRQQLTSLIDLLHQTNPWYVRCIKPNLSKCGDHYDDQQVLAQLRYLGMLDLIRIRREGYPIHYRFSQFANRFKCILDDKRSIKIDDQNSISICKCLVNYALDNLIKLLGKTLNTINHADYYQMGKNKIFLKLNLHENLELQREYLLNQSATKIQSYWRHYVVFKEYKQLKKASIRVQRQYRAIKQRLWFLRRKRATITIQAFVRGMFAREY